MDYFTAANQYYNTKDYQKAINLYKKAIDNKENEVCSYYNTSVCFIKLGEYEKAIGFLKSALALKSDSKYFFNLAYCYAMLKDNKRALLYFNTAWSMDSSDKDCEKAIKLILSNLLKHP